MAGPREHMPCSFTMLVVAETGGKMPRPVSLGTKLIHFLLLMTVATIL